MSRSFKKENHGAMCTEEFHFHPFLAFEKSSSLWILYYCNYIYTQLKCDNINIVYTDLFVIYKTSGY